MKIAICVNMYSPSIGGCEIVCKNIAEELHKNKHEVFIFTHRHKQRNLSDFPYKIIEFNGPADAPIFMRKLKSLEPDVIFVYSDLFDFFKYLISENIKSRFIIALCGANWLYENQNFIGLFKKNIANFHKIICHSKCNRDYKLCENSGLLDKTMIIPNGVNLSEFDLNNMTRKDLLPDCADKMWILNVSNFFPGKGQEHLIDIISGMKDLQHLVYIQVCSEIGYPIGQLLEESWKRKIEVSGLKKKGLTVKFLKNISRSKVVGFFKNSNVMCTGSESEVFPLTLLEAMASKTPWISADIGNAEELLGGQCIKTVKNSKGYSIFDERVIKLFSKHVRDYLLVSNLEAGREQLEKRMTWDKILPQYLSIIEN